MTQPLHQTPTEPAEPATPTADPATAAAAEPTPALEGLNGPRVEEPGAEETADPDGPVDWRNEEWAQPWMRAFLEAMTAMPNVTRAARHAQITYQAAYLARKRNPRFARAWEEAKGEGVENLEGYAHTMSTTGLETVETTVVTKEGIVNGVLQTVERKTIERRHRMLSPSMAQFLLSAHKPEMYRRPQKFEHTGTDGAPIEVAEATREAAVGAFNSAVVRLADRRRTADGSSGSSES